MSKILPGINIQWPISQEILSGKKTIETRTYPIPEKYLNQELYFIETPGKHGKFEARIVGMIRFISCFKYESEKAFYGDQKRHLVDRSSPWSWKPGTVKYGWEIGELTKFRTPKPAPLKKGIKFTTKVRI